MAPELAYTQLPLTIIVSRGIIVRARLLVAVLACLASPLMAPQAAHAADITFSRIEISTLTLFPERDGYHDDLDVSLQVDTEVAGLQFEYVNQHGATVATTEKVGGSGYYYDWWPGKDNEGNRVTEGDYHIDVVAWDGEGASVRQTLGTVALSWKRMQDIRTDDRVGAQHAVDERWAGTCSKVSSGVTRPWRFGLSLRSGSRCDGKAWPRSGVVVAGHETPPDGWNTGAINIDVNGGAAKNRSGSTAALELVTRRGNWKRVGILSSSVTNQSDGWDPVSRYLQNDGRVHWRVVTSNGNRYEIKSVKVSFEGSVLR